MIIALALFAFILSDVLTRGGGGSMENTVATINGTDLNRVEFMEKVEATQQNMGPNGNASQAMNIVWDREVRRVLMEEQFEKLGLTVGSNQLNSALSTYLASNPTFQDESGQYSEQRMLEYVAEIKANAQSNPQALKAWEDYVKNLKQTILENTYLGMLRGGLSSTLAEGEQQYRFENDKLNIEYVYVPYSSIPDEEITVTESEIAAYIKENPKKFEVEPQVDIQYVLIEEKASQEDIDAARAEMAELLENKVVFNNVTNSNDTVPGFRETTKYGEFLNAHSEQAFNDRWWFKDELPESIKDTVFSLATGEIYGPYQVDKTLNLTKVIAKRQLPDSARVRHILIPVGLNQTDSITRTDEQAKKTADSLLAIVKKSPSRFDDLVPAFTSDASSIPNKGVYDWFGYKAMVPAFRDFSFEMKKGDMGVVKSNFGYHIIEVLGQKDMKDVVKVATVSKEIEPSETTINNVFSKATTFELDAAKKDFAELAKEQEYSLRPVNKIGRLDSNIPGLGNIRSIVSWAFNEESEVGDVKRFNVPQGYVIAQLTRRNPKGLMSVSDASVLVTPVLRNKKKAEKIITSATGTTLQEIAASQNVTVQNASAITMSAPTIPEAGNEPKVVGAAFGKKAGEETGFIKGNSGVFKVRVLAVNAAPELENYASYANQLNTGVSQGLNTNVFKALKESADIEDNRANFY
jgi:parvulin-like peptidyl-prolyl isomerase